MFIIGVDVPTCYGRITYGGQSGLLLQVLEGNSLASIQAMLLELDELARRLLEAYRKLYALGVRQEDPQLGNFQLITGLGDAV
ncbi:hypothetical protein B0T25DRAFT_574182 [Lasiosphaeria hispida]|uniref:Uncharacterized protein n=1 Tax=Lasiosphaeria hispida TaxID=260671 RepID=A0AAJ0H7T8_9PEZI|nr:hypothetical protein B0T25DRAFT_574182 [Lasiosphaeria hispida]